MPHLLDIGDRSLALPNVSGAENAKEVELTGLSPVESSLEDELASGSKDERKMSYLALASLYGAS